MGTADSQTGQIIELCLSKPRNRGSWEPRRCHRLWEAGEGRGPSVMKVGSPRQQPAMASQPVSQTKSWGIGDEKFLSATYGYRQV